MKPAKILLIRKDCADSHNLNVALYPFALNQYIYPDP